MQNAATSPTFRDLEDCDLHLMAAISASEIDGCIDEDPELNAFWQEILSQLSEEKSRRRLAVNELERLYFMS